MKKVSKIEVQKQIEDFFLEIKNKSPEEIKKIKKLSMRHKIKLGTLRKTFCSKCYSPYSSEKVRIHKGIKSVKCKNCNHQSRWRIKLS